MRIKPPPGNYKLTISGITGLCNITATGMTCNVLGFTFTWEWDDLPDYGPILLPVGTLAPFVGLIGFEEPDVLVVYGPGYKGPGHYEPA